MLRLLRSKQTFRVRYALIAAPSLGFASGLIISFGGVGALLLLLVFWIAGALICGHFLPKRQVLIATALNLSSVLGTLVGNFWRSWVPPELKDPSSPRFPGAVAIICGVFVASAYVAQFARATGAGRRGRR